MTFADIQQWIDSSRSFLALVAIWFAISLVFLIVGFVLDGRVGRAARLLVPPSHRRPPPPDGSDGTTYRIRKRLGGRIE